jgi:predicted PurR-regulated permease PerM
VGGDTKMPDLLILLSTFGGLSMFGAVGLVLGPIIAAVFIAVWEIYGEEFGDLLRAEGPAAADGAVVTDRDPPKGSASA